MAAKETVAKVAGIEKLTKGQLTALLATAKTIGVPIDWLATVISFETGGTFSPSVRNKAGSGAFGLIQFMPNTAAGLLKLPADVATAKGIAMSFEQQLKELVIPYFKGGTYKSLNDLYLKVFFPAAMGQPDSHVVGDSNGTDFQQKVYTQNQGFDKAGKGYITREDITSRINSIFNGAQAYPRVVIAVGVWSQVFAGLAVSGAAIYAYMRFGKGKWPL